MTEVIDPQAEEMARQAQQGNGHGEIDPALLIDPDATVAGAEQLDNSTDITVEMPAVATDDVRKVGRLATLASRMEDRAAGMEPLGNGRTNGLFQRSLDRISGMRDSLLGRIETARNHVNDIKRIGRAGVRIGAIFAYGAVREGFLTASDAVGGVVEAGLDQTARLGRATGEGVKNTVLNTGDRVVAGYQRAGARIAERGASKAENLAAGVVGVRDTYGEQADMTLQDRLATDRAIVEATTAGDYKLAARLAKQGRSISTTSNRVSGMHQVYQTQAELAGSHAAKARETAATRRARAVATSARRQGRGHRVATV